MLKSGGALRGMNTPSGCARAEAARPRRPIGSAVTRGERGEMARRAGDVAIAAEDLGRTRALAQVYGGARRARAEFAEAVRCLGRLPAGERAESLPSSGRSADRAARSRAPSRARRCVRLGTRRDPRLRSRRSASTATGIARHEDSVRVGSTVREIRAPHRAPFPTSSNPSTTRHGPARPRKRTLRNDHAAPVARRRRSQESEHALVEVVRDLHQQLATPATPESVSSLVVNRWKG